MTNEVCAEKAAFARDGLERLAKIPQASLAEFLSDFRNLDATLHGLQTVIRALIDLGTAIVVGRGLRVPRTSLDVLVTLEEAGAVPVGTAVRFRPIVGFRNRVVHLYDRVDPEIVYRVLTEERDDLRALLGLLLAAADAP